MNSIILSASLTVSTVVDILKSNGEFESLNVLGLLDDDEAKQQELFYGLKVIGKLTKLKSLCESLNISRFVVGLGAVHHMLIRGALFDCCEKLNLKAINVIHNQTYISKDAELGRGQMILPFAAISPGCTIGNNSCINNNVSILEGCRVGDNVLIAGNSFVGGGCTIGKNVYIGPGVTIASGVSVGDNTIIGAGSLVLKDVEGNRFAHGSPINKVTKNNHYIPFRLPID